MAISSVFPIYCNLFKFPLSLMPYDCYNRNRMEEVIMKKLICILLAALLMISIISGCSKSTGTSSGTQEQGSHEGSGGPGKPPEGHGGPGGSSGGDIDYKGAVEITEKT